MSWSLQKKKGLFFVPFILSEGTFFNICVLSECIDSVWNTPSEYTYFYISKNIDFMHFFACF